MMFDSYLSKKVKTNKGMKSVPISTTTTLPATPAAIPIIATTTTTTTATTGAPIVQDDKYQRRLQANKKSAQASRYLLFSTLVMLFRERKKALKVELEQKVEILTKENAFLRTQMIQLETENRVLKNEFVQLQNTISESAIMSRAMAKQLSLLPTESVDGTVDKNTAQAAATLYLMMVLHSFGQYFKAPQSPAPLNFPLAV